MKNVRCVGSFTSGLQLEGILKEQPATESKQRKFIIYLSTYLCPDYVSYAAKENASQARIKFIRTCPVNDKFKEYELSCHLCRNKLICVVDPLSSNTVFEPIKVQ